MRRNTSTLRRAAALALILALIPATTVWGASPPEPTYGVADVDGNSAEWDLTGDFFADMHTAWQANKPVTSKLYLRYDCLSQTLYALVLAEPGHSIDTVDADHFIKVQGVKVMDESDGDNGVPPDFAYVGLNGSTAAGWEGSAAISPGAYDELTVHANVDGGATSGVVDMAVRLKLICYDLGDLPSTYPITTLANDGARHRIGNLFLGPTIDRDSDGQPNVSALGDDNNGDDEDGVWPPAGFIWSLADGGKLNVVVTGGNGCLSGWMDWNQNGNFGDPGENIINNQFVTPGQSQFAFPIPAGTLLDGNFFARFRLYEPVNSSCAGVTPSLTGTATNGEVEDYVFDPSTPTAVVITTLTARAGANVVPLALAAGGVFLLAGLAVVFRRQR